MKPVIRLALAACLLQLTLQGTALATTSEALVFGNSSSLVSSDQNLNGFSGSAISGVAFSDRDPLIGNSATFTGQTVYGGIAVAGGSASIDQWTAVDGSPDALSFEISAAAAVNTQAKAVFLWSRDDFASAFQNVDVMLQAAANGLKMAGGTSGGTNTSSIRFVIQDIHGNYYATSSYTLGAPGTIWYGGNPRVSNWYPFDTATMDISSSTPVSPNPTATPVFAVGVAFKVKKTSSAAVTAALSEFRVWADDVATASAANNQDDSALNLQVQSLSESEVGLTWTAQTGTDHYRVYASTSDFSGELASPVAKTTATGFRHFRQSSATKLYYRVVQYTGPSTSGTQSKTITVTTYPPEGAIARHPSIYFTRKELAAIKARCSGSPWSDWLTYQSNLVTGTGKYASSDPKITNIADADFILPGSARADAVTALTVIWLLDGANATTKASYLARIKDYLTYMLGEDPANPGTPISLTEANMIKYYDANGDPTGCGYGSPLYLAYAARAYGFAYDAIYNDLTPTERQTFRQNLQLNALILHDSTFAAPKNPPTVTQDDYTAITHKVNNWVMGLAGGLAVTGAAIRDYSSGGTNWGQAYLDDALTGLGRVIPAGGSQLNIYGDGAYIEGEDYSDFAGYYASEAAAALRAVNYSGTDYFTDANYQKWLAYRLKNLVLGGHGPLFEDARPTLSDKKRWVTAFLYEASDPEVQAQLQWLYSQYFDESTYKTTDPTALFYYPSTGRTASVPFDSYIDPDGGLVFFRSGLSGAATPGDDANNLVLAHENKPYGATLPDPDGGSPISLEHVRVGQGNYELWAYGGYLLNLPGYSGVPGASTSADAPQIGWSRTSSDAHNVVTIDGQNLQKTASGPFQGSSLQGASGRHLEFVDSIVEGPYNGAGSLERGIVFVRPTSATVGYFVICDRVLTSDSSYAVHSYIHGLGEVDRLSGSSTTVKWTNIQNLGAGGTTNVRNTNVTVTVDVASPALASGSIPDKSASPAILPVTQTFHEYIEGKPNSAKPLFVTALDEEYLDLQPASTGSTAFLYVIHPAKTSWSAPYADPTYNHDAPNRAVWFTPMGTSGAATGLTDVAATLCTGTAIQGITTDAQAFVARKNSATSRLDAYCVIGGSSLTYQTGSNTVGFGAAGNIDIEADDVSSGHLLATACNYSGSALSVTIYHPSLSATSSLSVDGVTVTSGVSKGTDYVTFNLATGNHEIDLTP